MLAWPILNTLCAFQTSRRCTQVQDGDDKPRSICHCILSNVLTSSNERIGVGATVAIAGITILNPGESRTPMHGAALAYVPLASPGAKGVRSLKNPREDHRNVCQEQLSSLSLA